MSRLDEISRAMFMNDTPLSVYENNIFYGRAVSNSEDGWVDVELDLSQTEVQYVSLDDEMDISDSEQEEGDEDAYFYTNESFSYDDDLPAETALDQEVLMGDQVFPFADDDINEIPETNDYNEPDPECDVPDEDTDGETSTAEEITLPEGQMIESGIGDIVPEPDVLEDNIIREPTYIGPYEPDEPETTVMRMPTQCVVFINDIVMIQLVGTQPTVIGVVGNGDLMQDEIDVLNEDITEIGYLVAEKANITDLNASNARISTLEATALTADSAVITDLQAEDARISSLVADKVDTNYLQANYLTTNQIDAGYARLDATNINTATIRDAFVDQLMVQTGLLSKAGTIYSLDAIEVNAVNITAGTIDVNRLIYTDNQGDKYLVEFNAQGQPTYEKMDGNIIEPRTITADKILANSITTNEITTNNLVGTGGWINLTNGTFNYNNASTGNGISWNGQNLSITANSLSVGTTNVMTKISSVETTANNASSTASSASSTASSALSTANTANTNASTALSTAQGLATDVQTAQQTANTANTNASTAISTANTADTNATNAQNRVGTIETMIREYSQGVLVCKTNQTIGSLVNANGSFDVCGITWSNGTPTAGTVYARYGTVSTIGLSNQNHFTIQSNKLIGQYGSEDAYFEVGDLRNQTLTTTFISDGTRYYTVYGASSISSVKNGSGTSLSYTTSSVSMGVRVNLSTAPTRGTKIVVSYSTQNTKLPYMLFGSQTGQKGIFSVSFGDNNEASGYASSVFGRGNVASGYYATATGYNNTASGAYSLVEGTLCEAQGNASHAEGIETKATGDSSHSEGSYSKAKGQDSHAEGNDTEARADFSHAGGQGTKAIGDAQTVIGRYNSTNTARAFIVGNGSSDTNRSNALALDWDGNMWITGNLSASGSLTVGSPVAINMGGTGQTAVETVSTISSIITADSNWTITACYIYKWGKMVMFRCLAKPTNAVSGSGNVVGTIKSAYRPAVQAMAVYGYNSGCRIMTNGEVQMSGSVSAGTSITISSTYLLA